MKKVLLLIIGWVWPKKTQEVQREQTQREKEHLQKTAECGHHPWVNNRFWLNLSVQHRKELIQFFYDNAEGFRGDAYFDDYPLLGIIKSKNIEQELVFQKAQNIIRSKKGIFHIIKYTGRDKPHCIIAMDID